MQRKDTPWGVASGGALGTGDRMHAAGRTVPVARRMVAAPRRRWARRSRLVVGSIGVHSMHRE